MKCVQCLSIAVIAASWSRIIVAQSPSFRPSGEFQILENAATQIPGSGRDWRRFGSGLEDERPSAVRVHFVASVEDSHPIAWVDRFGSGLEDDAPVRLPNVFQLSGLESLSSIQSLDRSPSSIRFGSGLEDERPITSTVRFGSGLEDDAPVRTTDVLYQPGF
jgi:hypothetical protein